MRSADAPPCAEQSSRRACLPACRPACLPARSDSSNTLVARIESGAASVAASAWASALLVAVGRNPWELLQRGVTAAARMSGALLAAPAACGLMYAGLPLQTRKQQLHSFTAPQVSVPTVCAPRPHPPQLPAALQAPPSTVQRRRRLLPWMSLASAPGTPSTPRFAAAVTRVWVYLSVTCCGPVSQFVLQLYAAPLWRLRLHLCHQQPLAALASLLAAVCCLQVSASGLQAGLRSLAAGGAPPKLLIIDDGWQRTDVDEEYRPAGGCAGGCYVWVWVWVFCAGLAGWGRGSVGDGALLLMLIDVVA